MNLLIIWCLALLSLALQCKVIFISKLSAFNRPVLVINEPDPSPFHTLTQHHPIRSSILKPCRVSYLRWLQEKVGVVVVGFGVLEKKGLPLFILVMCSGPNESSFFFPPIQFDNEGWVKMRCQSSTHQHEQKLIIALG